MDGCGEHAPNRFWTLINHVSHDIYFLYIEDCASCDMAIDALTKLYVQTLNKIFARHLLTTTSQHSGETYSEFLRNLENSVKIAVLNQLELNNIVKN